MAIYVNGKKVAGVGLPGPQGEAGLQGPAGADGKSPYQVAVEGGYTGTEAAFNQQLANLGREAAGTPAGTVLWQAGAAAPEGYLICDGSLVSRTDYAALFAAIGTTFGAGDGSETFALPDLRAAFIRGAGTQDGYSAAFGQKQQATEVANGYGYSGGTYGTVSAYNADKATNRGQLTIFSTTNYSNYSVNSYAVRPFNLALTPIIKY